MSTEMSRFIENPGRDKSYPSPTGQIRTSEIPASSSYLECLTQNLCSDHGWRVFGFGRYWSIYITIRSHVILYRRLRRL